MMWFTLYKNQCPCGGTSKRLCSIVKFACARIQKEIIIGMSASQTAFSCKYLQQNVSSIPQTENIKSYENEPIHDDMQQHLCSVSFLQWQSQSV